MASLMLLRQICAETPGNCQEHITFTLKKLTTQASITREDDTGNQQLYQIGNIFSGWVSYRERNGRR